MTKDSQVGSASIYEAADQRTTSNKEHKSDQRFEEGNKNAHNNLDSKDERSIKNRLAAASADASSSNEGPERSSDPRSAAISHGNEPSRGAKIDAELKADDEATLAKMQGK